MNYGGYDRNFNGKQYWMIWETQLTKGTATRAKKEFQKRGYLVRLIKPKGSQGHYLMYSYPQVNRQDSREVARMVV